MYYTMHNVKTPYNFLQVVFRVLSCNGTLAHLSDLHENRFSITFLLFTEAVVRRCFYKKGVLRNFTKFTGLRPATLLKKKLWRRCFPGNSVKFLRTIFRTEHLWWLLRYLWMVSLRICIRKYPWIRLKKLQNM